MKRIFPWLHFLSAALAFNLLAGCNKTDTATQDDGNAVIVSTFAGSGEAGDADGTGSAAKFRLPHSIAIDAAGNLYVTDGGGQRIRKVTPKGEVSTFAGSGEIGYADGIGSAAQFSGPHGIAIDATGNLYVTDTFHHRIRKITSKGEVSTLAGSEEGFSDGIGRNALFYRPYGIAIDAVSNLYVADTHNNLIRKVTPKGEVSTLAGGNGLLEDGGFADGVGSDARFLRPSGIAIDAAGNLYVVDTHNNRIRKVTPNGEVSTLAGSVEGFADGSGCCTRFRIPAGIAIDAAGNLYVADSLNHRIRKVTPKGEVSTIAGSEQGFSDGPGIAAKFSYPSGIAIDAAGNLYVADSLNSRIRKLVFVANPSSGKD